MGRFEPTLPPDPGRLLEALRAIGYSFESAVADIVDNSVNAKARKIVVRIICATGAINRVEIVDSGTGMSEAELHEAMRFGSRDRADTSSLGKYGMGLKLASLSHAQVLTVVSRRAGTDVVHGRRWTTEGIRRNWELALIRPEDAAAELPNLAGSVSTASGGTAVIWSGLDKLRAGKKGIEKTATGLKNNLLRHLGLMFHRFLQDPQKPVQLLVEVVVDQDRQSWPVEPLDPFGYEYESRPERDAPYRMRVSVGASEVIADCHIWPPNQNNHPNYKLPGGSAKAQGIYVYRNRRLIQHGGWNQIVDADSEPHLSLARVRIDLPPALDEFFSLDMKKSSIQPPPTFTDALKNAKTDDGITFSEYRAKANKIYRAKDHAATKYRLPVPNEGLAAGVKKRIQNILTDSPRTAQRIDLVWRTLDTPDVFRVDKESGELVLNRAYRKRLLGTQPASPTDLPALKVLLFMLLQVDFTTEKRGGARRRFQEQLNKLLLAAMGIRN